MPQKITSPSNPLVKSLKALHAKKARSETGLFLAEGVRLAFEAAEAGIWPEILCVSSAALARGPVARLTQEAEAVRVRVIETSETILAQIARKDNPQTVIGAYRQQLGSLETLHLQQPALVVALEGVRDPGNLGTILRTADSVGADGVVLIGTCCDPFSVEAVRATMGSIFAVPIVKSEFAPFNAWRQASGLSLIGAYLDGDVAPAAFEAKAPVALLMGNEQSGLPPEMAAACDARVRLPMRGRADSLNLSIATGVLLYDIWRRRGYEGAHG
jgi:TrmH family RNA methyltransferase